MLILFIFVVAEQVRYLSSIALYLSASLWLLMSFNVLCLNLLWSSLLTWCTPFRIISASMAAIMQYSSSVLLAFDEEDQLWLCDIQLDGFLFVVFMFDVFMDVFTSHSGELLVAKVKRTCILRAPEGISLL